MVKYLLRNGHSAAELDLYAKSPMAKRTRHRSRYCSRFSAGEVQEWWL